MKYIDSEKLIAEIERRRDSALERQKNLEKIGQETVLNEMIAFNLNKILSFITSLQQEQPMPDSTQLIEFWNEDKEMLKEKDFRDNAWRLAYNAFMQGFSRGISVKKQKQPDNMIQWTGNNLKEVIDFTGKSPRFGEWFKSWEEYENYVHTHNDILKLFCEDGSHYEVPIGAWIVKTPDGYNVPSVSRFVWEQPDVDKFDCPTTPIEEAIEVTSRMQHIDEEMKPIAKFIMDYASWNLHKDEWNQPVIEVPLFRVLDALVQRGKPYCGAD